MGLPDELSRKKHIIDNGLSLSTETPQSCGNSLKGELKRSIEKRVGYYLMKEIQENNLIDVCCDKVKLDLKGLSQGQQTVVREIVEPLIKKYNEQGPMLFETEYLF